MKKFHLILNATVMLALMLSVLVTVAPASAQTGGTRFDIAYDENGRPYVAGQVVVTMVKSSSKISIMSQAKTTAAQAGAEVSRATTSGTVLMNVPAGSEETAMEQLSEQSGVTGVELNYIMSIPQDDVTATGAHREYITRNNGTQIMSVSALQGMRTKVGPRIQAVYPNDPYLWDNAGWLEVNADILVGNYTASAGVCVLDTGVDYAHPDLKLTTVKGYDFVNADADPMDDNGHGTHVAGIIAAKANNKIGLAGVSTGKVVAVKVLDWSGTGTVFEVAAGIEYCANRTDIRVINMSLAQGQASPMLLNKITYATTTKGKLVVAAAGNLQQLFNYPAYYADTLGGVVAVGSSGYYDDNGTSGDTTDDTINYNCAAAESDGNNQQSWVSVVAPGTDILSTIPLNRQFYMASEYDLPLNSGYAMMSGTSMSTAFVSAAAARYWGYAPASNNEAVKNAVINSGEALDADGTCWNINMNGKHKINVATLLGRGAMQAGVYDASTGMPLVGASILAYQGSALRSSGVTTLLGGEYTDIVNLPAGGLNYTLYVNRSGYTIGNQAAFRQLSVNPISITAGEWAEYAPVTAIPPKSTYFDIVGGWEYKKCDICLDPDPDKRYNGLDMYVWLPDGSQDPAQIGWFIVGNGNSGDFGFVFDPNPLLPGDYVDEMTAAGYLGGFPFARQKIDGGKSDQLPFANTTIRSRLAHGVSPNAIAASAYLPYYPGDYYVRMYDGTLNDATGSGNVPMMGLYYIPYVYIWKDGLIKFYNMLPTIPTAPGGTCNSTWWDAVKITSGRTGTAPVYNNLTLESPCAHDENHPYGH